MNINHTPPKLKETTFKKGNNAMVEKSFEDMKKDTIKKLYARVRAEVPQKGIFKKVAEVFSNPKTKDVYIMEVAPSHAPNLTSKRYLNLGVEIPDSPNKLSFSVAEGTKQEILDYLGNDANSDEVTHFYQMLEKKAKDI